MDVGKEEGRCKKGVTPEKKYFCGRTF